MYNFNLNIILGDGQDAKIINRLCDEIFLYRLNHLHLPNQYLMFIESQFSDYFLNNYIIQAIDSLFIKKEISVALKGSLIQKNCEYFSKTLYQMKNSTENLIVLKRNFIKKAILAILYSFKRNDLLGAKKRMKLLYLLKYDNLRLKALSIGRQMIKSYNNFICNDIIMGSYGEMLEFQHYLYGQFEPTVKEHIIIALVNPGLIEPVNSLNSKPSLFRITSLGEKEIGNLFKKDNEFCKLVEICSQLAELFDNYNNTEFEWFLKDYVDIDWNKYGMEEFYDDHED